MIFTLITLPTQSSKLLLAVLSLIVISVDKLLVAEASNSHLATALISLYQFIRSFVPTPHNDDLIISLSVQLLGFISRKQFFELFSWQRLVDDVRLIKATLIESSNQPSEASLQFLTGQLPSTAGFVSLELSVRRRMFNTITMQCEESLAHIRSHGESILCHDMPTLFPALSENDEMLFDFLNISVQLQMAVEKQRLQEVSSQLLTSNLQSFALLMNELIHFDLTVMLDFLCGHETVALEYFLRFFKAHRLSQLSGIRIQPLSSKAPPQQTGSRSGVVILVSERIVHDEEDGRQDSPADIDRPRLKPVQSEWENHSTDVSDDDKDNYRETNTDPGCTTVEIHQIRDFLIMLKDRLLRSWKKKILLFNPSAFVRNLVCFLEG